MAAVGTRHPRVPTHGEHHLASRAVQFVGDLHAGGRGTDDQYRPGWKLRWIAVAVSGEHLARRLGRAGIRGTPCGPVAITTLAVRQVPRSVTTR